MAGKLSNQGDELQENHEINVTPFIDVMLVLLIIFMVAAPLSTVDVQVDLPVANSKPQPRPEKPIFVTIKADKSLTLGNDPLDRSRLGSSIDVLTSSDREKRIFLRADKTVPYSELMDVMNLLRSSGYVKIGLVGLEATSQPNAQATGSAPTDGSSKY